MRSGASAPGSLGESATIRLRSDRFLAVTRMLGCESEAARARLLGVDRKTIQRARAGQVGERFVAQTISALRRYEAELAEYGMRASFDELFEVVSVEAA